MKTNIKSLGSFNRKLADSVLKSNELLGVRGGGQPNEPPIITPE